MRVLALMMTGLGLSESSLVYLPLMALYAIQCWLF